MLILSPQFKMAGMKRFSYEKLNGMLELQNSQLKLGVSQSRWYRYKIMAGMVYFLFRIPVVIVFQQKTSCGIVYACEVL